MNGGRPASIVLAALLVAGCGAGIATELTPDESHTRSCDSVQWLGDLRVISCAEAVAAAEARVAGRGPATSVTFSRAFSLDPKCQGVPVPCPEPQRGVVWFEFLAGPAMYVGVELHDDGVVEASEPLEGRREDVLGI